MATLSEQLVTTSRMVEDSSGSRVSDEARPSWHRLDALNVELRGLLRRLRDELGQLFTTGTSEQLRLVLRELTAFSEARAPVLQAALAGHAAWTESCQAPTAAALYQTFETLAAEQTAVDAQLAALGEEVFSTRARAAGADGALAGAEERLGRVRPARRGEEYNVERYFGTALLKDELLRTKVAHHLAHAFTAAKEEASAGTGDDTAAAERHLDALEEQLTKAAGQHRELVDRRKELSTKMRTFLKSLLLQCENAVGGASAETQRLRTHIQVAEELSRFLNATFHHTLPQTIELVTGVTQPYIAIGSDALVLPKTWKARPKIGKWWEWIGGGAQNGQPVAQEEFEKRFAKAKRRFSARVSAAEPVVMSYILWLLLEDALGAAPDASQPEAPLALGM